jgi:EAL domain-containing protein (putative c-di-GMP-specific phosphodiesterase class I)
MNAPKTYCATPTRLCTALKRTAKPDTKYSTTICKTGKIVGFEALARWLHPTRGLVSPADFVPLAEETGLIVPLGLTILKQACEQTVEWQKQLNFPKLTISVNLSGRQFKQSDLVEQIRKTLLDADLHPHHLRMEITETIVMENPNAAIEMLKQLKGMGVRLSVDDFGTGYSSLSYLHRFPFDILKIDRSFVSRMTTDKESHGIVKTILALAAELDKEVVAEGIEKIEHREMLHKLSCQYGQGYLFSKPLDAFSAEELLKNDLLCHIGNLKPIKITESNSIPVESVSHSANKTIDNFDSSLYLPN